MDRGRRKSVRKAAKIRFGRSAAVESTLDIVKIRFGRSAAVEITIEIVKIRFGRSAAVVRVELESCPEGEEGESEAQP